MTLRVTAWRITSRWDDNYSLQNVNSGLLFVAVAVAVAVAVIQVSATTNLTQDVM